MNRRLKLTNKVLTLLYFTVATATVAHTYFRYNYGKWNPRIHILASAFMDPYSVARERYNGYFFGRLGCHTKGSHEFQWIDMDSNVMSKVDGMHTLRIIYYLTFAVRVPAYRNLENMIHIYREAMCKNKNFDRAINCDPSETQRGIMRLKRNPNTYETLLFSCESNEIL